MASVCLQLGCATVSDTSEYSQSLIAKTADEISATKNGFTPASLDKLDVIVDGSELENLYHPMELANWAPFLSPKCVVSIRVTGTAPNLQVVNTSFLLAGLVGASERKNPDGSRVLTATKPKATPKIGAAPLRTKQKVVTVSIGDLDDDDDMIDEDGLLEDTVLAPPPAMGTQAKDSDDCAGRKPCDNCSCGRAEIYAAEQAGKKVPEEGSSGVPSSNCGKCNLGDAFRCASCPFLGKPAFKAGEEHVVLQMTDDL